MKVPNTETRIPINMTRFHLRNVAAHRGRCKRTLNLVAMEVLSFSFSKINEMCATAAVSVTSLDLLCFLAQFCCVVFVCLTVTGLDEHT